MRVPHLDGAVPRAVNLSHSRVSTGSISVTFAMVRLRRKSFDALARDNFESFVFGAHRSFAHATCLRGDDVDFAAGGEHDAVNTERNAPGLT